MGPSLSLATRFRESAARLLFEQIDNLQIEPERAQKIARDLGGIVPDTKNDDETLRLISLLKKKYPELGEVIRQFNDIRIERLRSEILRRVGQLIKEGKINKAQEIIKRLEDIKR